MAGDSPCCVRTLRLKVKREGYAWLNAAAIEVNQVWNYANEISHKAARPFAGESRWLSAFDLDKLTAGATEFFAHIGSETIQRVNAESATRRKQVKGTKLRWRTSTGSKRSLGWIPFRAVQLKRKGKGLRFSGKAFRVFEREPLQDVKWKSGCFAQDAVGDWWLCLPVERAVSGAPAPLEAVGIDLGLKDTAATSDGDKLLAGQFYRGIEQRISLAQRHGHKRQAKRLHRTAARRRKDALHKFSGQMVGKYQQIIIGDVSSLKLAKTRMAKSVLDAGWGMLKAQLKYKGEYAGRCVLIIDERNTTRTCSSCRALTGPSGLDRLVVRRWVCSGCGVTHDRDVNAARNILFAGVSWKLETISSEAIAKMGVGPSESPFRRRLQTAHCCDGRKSMVVSEWVKYAAKLREVGVGKMSESKPPMTYREDVIVVKTGGAADLHDQCMGSSDYCVHGNRYTGGMSPMQALLWNHENLPDDAKGKRRAADTASTNTDASGRGGVTCSSDEGSVTDPERRGHSVQKMQSVNRPSDGRNR